MWDDLIMYARVAWEKVVKYEKISVFLAKVLSKVLTKTSFVVDSIK